MSDTTTCFVLIAITVFLVFICLKAGKDDSDELRKRIEELEKRERDKAE
jgi:hypothetical protein